MGIELLYITNDPKEAIAAQNAGIERIFLDLETEGKAKRQGHKDTFISKHNINDIESIAKVLDKSKLLVRVNPLNINSSDEINEVIKRGANYIMLPMFTLPEEVKKFIEIIRKRTKVSLLLETPESLVRLNEILEIDGIDEIHIGLNDLHLGMGLDFMFELLSEGIVDYIAKKIKKKGIKFGFGGISLINTGDLNSSLILSEHVRLGSTMVILSRGFRKAYDSKNINALYNEVSKFRREENNLRLVPKAKLLANRKKLIKKVREIRREIYEKSLHQNN